MSRTRKILSIKIEHLCDTDPMTDHIGEYTDEWDPYHFDRQEGKMLKTLERDRSYCMPDKGREYRFFKPYAAGEEPGTALYIRYGKQDLARMEGLERGAWSYIGIRATALITHSGSDIVQKITSGGLWGIESDAGDEHHTEVEDDELHALREELKAVGFIEDLIDSVEVERP